MDAVRAGTAEVETIEFVLMDEMPCTINWDKKLTAGETAHYSLKIRTGMSILISNRITVLKMRDAVNGVTVERKMFTVLRRLSEEHPAGLQRAGFPDIRLYDIQHKHGCLTFAAVWGIVLNGSKKGRLLQGEFRFVVIGDEQLDDCLSRVFELDRLYQSIKT
jgi:hypothetical protein